MITCDMILEAQATILENWGESGKKVVEECAKSAPLNMKSQEFLQSCVACGGNWGGMLLSGIQALRPNVWEAIPDDMGVCAWGCICSVLILCGVDTSEK